MIFDTDVMIWAFRGNGKALDAIDEATASRIIERAKANTLNISRKDNRNYRLRDVVEV